MPLGGREKNSRKMEGRKGRKWREENTPK